MANPITWRNVQSRGSSGVAELLNGASTSINRGISSFQGALTDQQDAQERNRLNQRENNLQNLNDAVARYDTPEALQAAQASGAFDALTSVPNMDRDAARNVADDRVTELQGLATDQYNYDQGVLDQQASPIEEEYLGILNSGDTDAAKLFLNANSGLLTQSGDLGRLTQVGDNQERTLLDREHADQARDRDLRIQNDDEAMIGFSNMASNAATEAEGRAIFEELAQNAGINPTSYDKFYGQFSQTYADRNSMTSDQLAALEMERGSAAIEKDGRYRIIESIYNEETSQAPVNERLAWTDGEFPAFSASVKAAESQGWDKKQSLTGSNIGDHLAAVKANFIATRKNDNAQLSDADLLAVDGVLLRAVESMGEGQTNFFGYTADIQDKDVGARLNLLWDEYKISEKNLGLRQAAVKRRDNSLQGTDIAAAARYNNLYGEITLKNDANKRPAGGMTRTPRPLTITQ